MTSRDDVMDKIMKHAMDNPEKMKTIEAYCKELGITNPTPTNLKSSFVMGYRKMDMLKVTRKDKVGGESKTTNFYGFSDVCGQRMCYYDWCKGYKPGDSKFACPLGNPNPNLKFVEL